MPLTMEELRVTKVTRSHQKIDTNTETEAFAKSVVTRDLLKESFKNLYDFYRNYEMPLARAFHRVDKKGIQTDAQSLGTLREDVVRELGERCVSLSKVLGGRPVVYSEKMAD